MKNVSLILLIIIYFSLSTLNANADNENDLLIKGSVLYKESKFIEAIDVFTETIKLFPSSSKAYIYRGMVYVKISKYDNAISDFIKSIELNPNDYKPHHYLAKIYSHLNDYEKCYFHIEQSVIKGYNDYNHIKNLIDDEEIKYSYDFYKFILNLKSKYKYHVTIDFTIPFHELIIDSMDSDLGENATHKSHLFQDERNRLRNNFEKSVLTFTDNIEKCYWISFFLSSECYLHGNKPLYDLSLKIIDKGIRMCENNDEVPTEIIGLSVNGALISYKINNLKLAKSYKNITEKYLQKSDMYECSFPALNDEDINIYNSL